MMVDMRTLSALRTKGIGVGWPFTLAALLMIGTTSRADVVHIDFEDQVDGAVISGLYKGLVISNGVVLTAGISLNEFEFPPNSGSNVLSDLGGPLSIRFALPVTSISGFVTYSVPLVITAFDAQSGIVFTLTSQFGNNMAISGESGSVPNERISINPATPVSRLTIAGDPNGGSFVLDDVSYTSSVPEPSSALLASVAFGLVLVRRNRNLVRRLLLSVLPTLLALSITQAKVEAQTIASTATILAPQPEAVVAGMPTSVKVSAIVTGDVLPGSVNLVRDNMTLVGSVVGQLTPDPSVGVPGGYSIRLNVAESKSQTIRFQVSAAIRGQLRRVVSSKVRVAITAGLVSMPPDPGENGKLTVAGIDSDSDGVRDDVQREIVFLAPESARVRALLKQRAEEGIQAALVSQTPSEAVSAAKATIRTVVCQRSLGLESDRRLRVLVALAVDTNTRLRAYEEYQRMISGRVFTIPSTTTAQCSFRPETLPN